MMQPNDPVADREQSAKERFNWLLFVVLLFGPILMDALLSDWLHRTLPSIPKLLEYAILAVPALVVALILYRYRVQVIRWFENNPVNQR